MTDVGLARSLLYPGLNVRFAALFATEIAMRPTYLALGLALATAPLAQTALACGGCFSPPAPTIDQTVVQNAERVLFYRDATTKKSTVWVEVRYSGLAQDFGWVLPVPKVPKVGVGSTVVFDALDQKLRARYNIEYGQPENCRDAWQGCNEEQYYPSAGGGDFGGADTTTAGDSSASDAGGPGAPKVEVLAQGTTGPYDYQVVASNDANMLYTWLNTRGYAIPEKSKPIIDSHIKKGDKFVAVKLSNGQGIKAIRPITLEMDDSEACVPLRLTSIAAAEDMQVVVTVAGPNRAIVKNYMDVEPNPLRLNLLSGGTQVPCAEPYSGYCTVPNNFDQVASAAIDEAAGRAFVTEAVVSGGGMGQLSPLQSLKASQFTYATNLLDLGQVLAGLTGVLPIDDDTAAVMAPHLPLDKVMPGVNPTQALANLRACANFWQMGQNQPCQLPGYTVLQASTLLAATFDPQPLADDVTTNLVGPIDDAAKKIAGNAWVSRLSLRISPDEMDRDPVFAYNSALPAKAQERKVKANVVCLDGWNNGPQGFRLTLDGLGSWVLGQDALNTKDPRFAQAPYALTVQLQDETGPAMTIAPEQVDLVDGVIKGALPGQPSLPNDMVLKTPVPWAPPASDVLVTKVGAWHKPGSWCEPKAGWSDGKMAPAGDVPQSDAGSTSGPVPGVDAVSGWTDAVSPQATVSKASGASEGSGCTAGTHSNSAWGLLMLAGLGLLVRRRPSQAR